MWGTAAGNLYLSYFRPSFRTDIGVNAYLLNDRLSVWLKVSDLFNTDKENKSTYMNGIYVYKNRQLDRRGVMLQLRYTINPQGSKYKGRNMNSESRRF